MPSGPLNKPSRSLSRKVICANVSRCSMALRAHPFGKTRDLRPPPRRTAPPATIPRSEGSPSPYRHFLRGLSGPFFYGPQHDTPSLQKRGLPPDLRGFRPPLTLPGPLLRDLRGGPAQGAPPRSRTAHPDRHRLWGVLTHVDAEIKSCPHCEGETRGAFPEAFSGPVQYGAGIKAYVLNLVIAQMISLKRAQQSIQSLIGLMLSEATILKYVGQLHQALARWEQSAIERLLARPTLHVDETSLRVDKHNHWIHVCSGGGDITLKFVHERRGLEAMTAIGIIPRYGGILIHDCWASYLSYDHCGHGLCGAHLLRELAFIHEANGYAWARNMKGLLQKTCSLVSKRKRKRLTPREYEALPPHPRPRRAGTAAHPGQAERSTRSYCQIRRSQPLGQTLTTSGSD